MSNTTSLELSPFTEEPCPLCKGNKVAGGVKFSMVMSPGPVASEEALALTDSMSGDDTCPHCNGAGTIIKPPFGDGSTAQISADKIKILAGATTVMRNIGEATMIQSVANEAARVTLPDEIVEVYKAYWEHPQRDVTLGKYITQIAETAEQLAMNIFGNLGDKMYAGPRIAPEPQPEPVTLDPYHFHEVEHTASLVADTFERHIAEHVAVVNTPELLEAARKAADALHEFYQFAAEIRHSRN